MSYYNFKKRNIKDKKPKTFEELFQNVFVFGEVELSHITFPSQGVISLIT